MFVINLLSDPPKIKTKAAHVAKRTQVGYPCQIIVRGACDRDGAQDARAPASMYVFFFLSYCGLGFYVLPFIRPQSVVQAQPKPLKRGLCVAWKRGATGTEKQRQAGWRQTRSWAQGVAVVALGVFTAPWTKPPALSAPEKRWADVAASRTQAVAQRSAVFIEE